MGPKYLQVAVGRQRSFSLGETKLSCEAECSITQMFFVFAVGAQSCNKTALKKRGSYDHSKPSLTSRTMAVINPPFISNFVWNIIHGRPNQWGQRSENNGGVRPRGKQRNLCQFISCHRSGLCPAKNVGALPFVAPSQQHVRVFGQGAQISGGLPSPSEASSWRRGIGRPRLTERNVSYFCNVKQI